MKSIKVTINFHFCLADVPFDLFGLGQTKLAMAYEPKANTISAE